MQRGTYGGVLWTPLRAGTPDEEKDTFGGETMPDLRFPFPIELPDPDDLRAAIDVADKWARELRKLLRLTMRLSQLEPTQMRLQPKKAR